MERFSGMHVRLRSRLLGTYLHADDNGLTVSLSADGASLNAVWRVELVHLRRLRVPGHYFSLQGAAYGRYLAVSPEDAQRGRGHLLRQHVYYGEPNHVDALWRALMVGGGAGNEVRIRHCRYSSCHIGVAVQNPDEVSTHWVVEMVPWRRSPALPIPLPNQGFCLSVPTRTIIFARSEDGMSASTLWGRIYFTGRSVHNLREELTRRLGEPNPSNITIYAWTGYSIPRIPLVVDLPASMDAMVIGVLSTHSPAALALRHPDAAQ